ncbi:DUF6412 domain-containing protein [Streptomyces sp. WAC 00631]|uniref:DUF6412 domain-containing protein n=1 Tax=Streptomyces sp. WAC 00631 TaxID=2203201 RepID=UPI000F795097|nr:DUF6412 domain-containing protein [Streptomyces sp. WAC 00631]MCC5033225.1 DUF6412 domain-containing protein [Streptomyces sp. WAC 00631]
MGLRAATRTHLGVLLVLLSGLSGLLLAPGGLAEGALAGAVSFAATATATAAAGAALLVCAVLAARSARPVPPTRVRTALRDRERRTAFLPQRDPDASGRPRPRAPGRPLPTAG